MDSSKPSLSSLCIIPGVDEVKELRVLSLGGSLGERHLLLGFLLFVSHHSTLFFNLKLINLIFPKLNQFCCGDNWQVSGISVFILTFKFAILFCPLSC